MSWIKHRHMYLRMKYKVTLNWYGELHILYTNAKSENGALENVIWRLAKKLGKSRWIVKSKFYGDRDNFEVREVIE